MSELVVDVAVVGGGPAGMAAAMAAARANATVALIDEYAASGGQIWRRRFDEVGEAAPASLPAHAARLCAQLASSSVEVLAGATVWAAPARDTLLLTGAVSRVRASAVVLATGAYDRPVAFPGWTLPGVMTAGGAQALAKGQGVVPGQRVLLAGAGPFLLPVAEQLAKHGAEVVAVVEATRRRDWLRAAPRMAAYPARLVDYARYRTSVRRVVWGQVLVRAEGDGRVERATIASAGADWAPSGAERTYAVDAVCTAYGFLPSVDLARALGCALDGDAVAHDHDMRTTIPNVFVAGEATGIGGADLAQVEGELAGWMAAAHTRHTNGHAHATAPAARPAGRAAAARSAAGPDSRPARATAPAHGAPGEGAAAADLRRPAPALGAPNGGAAQDARPVGRAAPALGAPDGRAAAPDTPPAGRAAPLARPAGATAAPDARSAGRAAALPSPDLAALRRRRAKLAGFAAVLGDLFDPRPGLLTLAGPDTVLCRCEDVTAGAVDSAVAAGATTMAALKVVTRCGQGRARGARASGWCPRGSQRPSGSVPARRCGRSRSAC